MIRHLHIKMKQIAFPLIAACISAYFLYHGVNGERGLIAWQQYNQQIKTAQAELDKVLIDRAQLEKRVALLSNNKLDMDMLDERARAMLNFAAPDERVIFLKNSAPANAAVPKQ